LLDVQDMGNISSASCRVNEILSHVMLALSRKVGSSEKN